MSWKRGLYKRKKSKLSQEGVQKFLKSSFAAVYVEKGAGQKSSYPDEEYKQAGATNAYTQTVSKELNVVLKVCKPQTNEADLLKENSKLNSFLHQAQNKVFVEKLKHKKITSFAIEQISRKTRSQTYHALSLMTNIAGY